jgi:hypothetical protein
LFLSKSTTSPSTTTIVAFNNNDKHTTTSSPPTVYHAPIMNISVTCEGSLTYVPTSSPFCAVEFDITNGTSVLSSCCNGSPIATCSSSNSNSTAPAFQYCNLASVDLVNSTQKCLGDAFRAQHGSGQFTCGKGAHASAAGSPPSAGLAKWVVMGLLASTMVFGVDLM